MDYLEADEFGRPRVRFHRAVREPVGKYHRAINREPRYCVKCGEKLSIYNKSKECWTFAHLVETKSK